jgi:hypothetical protein
MEFYSATKKNEILSSAGKWMKLENISEVSQIQKVKNHVFSHMWNIDLIQYSNIMKTGHAKGKSYMRGGGFKKVNIVDVLSIQE